jgi:hypothetical protein
VEAFFPVGQLVVEVAAPVFVVVLARLV